MYGVQSWDKDHLLVGTGPFWILDFVERGEASDKNTIEGRAALARKAYGDRLKDVYRSFRAHKEGSPLANPGGFNLMEQTIGAYFAMIQAERDAEAGRAVEDEPIDSEGDVGSARKTWYRQSHDDACRHESPMAGRPQRDAVGGDAGRIMDPHGRRRRQPRHAAAAKRGASERARREVFRLIHAQQAHWRAFGAGAADGRPAPARAWATGRRRGRAIKRL
jgi:hypothetical protein